MLKSSTSFASNGLIRLLSGGVALITSTMCPQPTIQNTDTTIRM